MINGVFRHYKEEYFDTIKKEFSDILEERILKVILGIFLHYKEGI